jgi:hypothetical protein
MGILTTSFGEAITMDFRAENSLREENERSGEKEKAKVGEKTNLRADILIVHAPESMKSQRFFVANFFFDLVSIAG